jgi:hypothetical protein
MSANTYWRPVTRGKAIDCLSSFLDVLAEAKDESGLSEIVLTSADEPLLRGIAAADKSLSGAVEELLSAIRAHEKIYVWREY